LGANGYELIRLDNEVVATGFEDGNTIRWS